MNEQRKGHTMRSFYAMTLWSVVIFTGLCGWGHSQSVTENEMLRNHYFMKISCYPDDATHDWNPNGVESQGVTHDDHNWYFTTTDHDGENARLWRIPVDYALDQDVKGLPGVDVISQREVPLLWAKFYNHWGDPDHYRYKGIDYIFVPVTSEIGMKPGIAVFNGKGMSFVSLCTPGESKQLRDIGWCAVSPEGALYTSPDDATLIMRYSIEWEKLRQGIPEFTMIYQDSYYLRDHQSRSMILHNMQGGEFSPDGKLLYISCGSGECMGKGHGRYDTDGIQVIDTESWQVIRHSANGARGQHGLFDFSFNNGCACLTGSQTPEGLTVWDLDDGRAPNVAGQLHVLVNFYNRYAACDDAISFQHFRSISNDYSKFGKIPPAQPQIIGVILYEHPYYKGDYRYFTFNQTNLDIDAVNFADVASSVRLFNIHGAKVYDGKEYTGKYLFIRSDIPDLRTLGWNEVIGSLRIIRNDVE